MCLDLTQSTYTSCCLHPEEAGRGPTSGERQTSEHTWFLRAVEKTCATLMLDCWTATDFGAIFAMKWSDQLMIGSSIHPSACKILLKTYIKNLTVSSIFLYVSQITRSSYASVHTHSHSHWLIDWLTIAYIALFSALLSRLTALVCGSTWVTSFL